MIWKLLSAALGVLVLALGIPAVRHLRERPAPPLPVTRAQMPVPAGVTIGSGATPLDAAIAPDEQQVAFIATREGTSAIWIQSMATGSTAPIAGTDGASLPAWSRDGQRLAFFAQGRLKSVTLSSARVSELSDAPSVGGAAWLDDGSIVFSAGRDASLRRLSSAGLTDVTTLSAGDVAHVFPFVDSAGRLLYVAVRNNGSRVVRLLTDTGGAPKRPPFEGESRFVDLTETAAHAELRNDMLVHVRDDVLLAQRLDPNELRLIGRSAALATGVGHSSDGHGYFATSPRVALWSPAVSQLAELVWFNSAGERQGTAAEPGDYWQVRLSPDERSAAVTVLDPLLRTLDVSVVPLASPGEARRVSLGIGPDTDPVWSADASRVFFRTLQSGTGAVVSRPAALSKEPERAVVQRRSVDVTPSDSRGSLLFGHTQPSSGRTRSVVVVNLASDSETALAPRGFSSWDARLSPDGRWLAYTADESGVPEIYIQAWPLNGGQRVRATFGGGQRPRWSGGDTLYFNRGDAVMRTRVSGAASASATTPEAVFTATGLRDFSVSPTANRLLVITPRSAEQAPGAFLIFDWAAAVPLPPAPPPRL